MAPRNSFFCSSLSCSYKQMQQETQEYFMKLSALPNCSSSLPLMKPFHKTHRISLHKRMLQTPKQRGNHPQHQRSCQVRLRAERGRPPPRRQTQRAAAAGPVLHLNVSPFVSLHHFILHPPHLIPVKHNKFPVVGIKQTSLPLFRPCVLRSNRYGMP